jgi:hypothetical protein
MHFITTNWPEFNALKITILSFLGITAGLGFPEINAVALF